MSDKDICRRRKCFGSTGSHEMLHDLGQNFNYPLHGADVETYEDHRMAMCFSLASLKGVARNGTSVRINDPKCVAKTFPEYFEALAGILQGG